MKIFLLLALSLSSSQAFALCNGNPFSFPSCQAWATCADGSKIYAVICDGRGDYDARYRSGRNGYAYCAQSGQVSHSYCSGSGD